MLGPTAIKWWHNVGPYSHKVMTQCWALQQLNDATMLGPTATKWWQNSKLWIWGTTWHCSWQLQGEMTDNLLALTYECLTHMHPLIVTLTYECLTHMHPLIVTSPQCSATGWTSKRRREHMKNGWEKLNMAAYKTMASLIAEKHNNPI